jgi:hypothetical protein
MKVLGVIIMMLGLAFGIYAGFWWAFIGGIIDVVNAVQATPVSGMGIAFGVAKVVFAWAIGVVSVWVTMSIGYVIYAWKK